jgi:hypothetical protein
MWDSVSVALIKTSATADELIRWLEQCEKEFVVDFVLAWWDGADYLPRYSVNLDKAAWPHLTPWTEGWGRVRARLLEGVASGVLPPFEPTRWVGAQ